MSRGLLVLALLLPSASVEAAEFIRRPYLQNTSDTATTLVWRTDVPTGGEVRYGTDPSNLDRTASSGAVAEDHAVRITGLEPETRYHYAVYAGTDLLASELERDLRDHLLHTFTTHPVPGEQRSFRAWVVGDSGTGSLRQLQVFDAMLDHVGPDRPDLYLHLGDMAYGDGTDEEFTTRFYAPYADLLSNTTIWPTLGNHEGRTSTSFEQEGPYFEGYHLPAAGEAGGLPSGTEAYYSFDYADAHFIVLDSYDSDRSPDGPMLTWLAEDLAATDQTWIVAYFHHPPYTKGSHDSDREIEHIEMRENATPILEAGGVDIVLGGHSHVYERSYLVDGAYETPSTSRGILDDGDGRVLGDGPYRKEPGAANDGALYVTAGHGGTSVRSRGLHPLMFVTEPINGSVLLDFEPNRLTITNVRYTGEVSDQAVLVKGPAVVLGAPEGDQQMRPGSRQEVRWASTGDVGPVRLDYTCDDGATWEPIVDSTADDGRHFWIAPEVESRAMRVRVTAVGDETLTDASNSPFYVGRVGPYPAVEWGAVWKYWDKPERPGQGWNLFGFNDSRWQEGPGEFGFGDGDEATVLAGRPVHPTYYFRKEFRVADDVSAAWLRTRFDDGVAIYIDGVLVTTANLEDTAHGAPALASSSDNELIELPLSPELFGPGDHAIAAMVKQHGTSIDLSFDATLEFTFSRSAARPCGAPVPADPADPGPPDCAGCEASVAGGAGGVLALGVLAVGRRRR